MKSEQQIRARLDILKDLSKTRGLCVDSVISELNWVLEIDL